MSESPKQRAGRVKRLARRFGGHTAELVVLNEAFEFPSDHHFASLPTNPHCPICKELAGLNDEKEPWEISTS